MNLIPNLTSPEFRDAAIGSAWDKNTDLELGRGVTRADYIRWGNEFYDAALTLAELELAGGGSDLARHSRIAERLGLDYAWQVEQMFRTVLEDERRSYSEEELSDADAIRHAWNTTDHVPVHTDDNDPTANAYRLLLQLTEDELP